VDALAITHLDRTKEMGLYCAGYVDPEKPDGVIPEIPVLSPSDLEGREAFTATLGGYQAHYQNWPEKFPKPWLIQSVLDKKVTLVSWGPTWKDRSENLDIVPDRVLESRPTSLVH
jgi:hypothetical protein